LLVSSVSDAVVFVTGAARGIGAGTARALAQRGARVILVDLEPLLTSPLGERESLGRVPECCR
jgi:NAD(P)-dependent dehydrogenase (short-subunit alcohol dehydrogenase family)